MSHNCQVVHAQLLHVHTSLANHLCCICVHQDPGQTLCCSALVEGTDALAQLRDGLVAGMKVGIQGTFCSPLSLPLCKAISAPSPSPPTLTMMTPVSLLANMRETKQVFGWMAARTSSTSACPLRGDTGTKVASAGQKTSPEAAWVGCEHSGLPVPHWAGQECGQWDHRHRAGR